MAWPACLNEYEKLLIRMDTPRVVIDNAVCPIATLVKVDSARKHDILLEAVQVLTDLNLSIEKAYISSDGRWFMDVFHVTDQFGRKLTDESVISYLEQSLETEEDQHLRPIARGEGFTALELTGADRPGLLSEVFAVLTDLGCGVVEAKVWTHNGRIACLVSIHDELSGESIDYDSPRIRHMESRLLNVLKGDGGVYGARIVVSAATIAHPDRRLHQMMFADRDYERTSPPLTTSSTSSPSISVQNWIERGYSVVTVQCLDRQKLLFDVVCTLTDMEYVVFHGTIDIGGHIAHQEFYIRHKDGSPISSEAERQRMVQCLRAAIERRSIKGQRLELYMEDRPGLLSEVTRTLRENGLLVTRADVSSKGDMISSVFYVTDAAGQPAGPGVIDAVRQRIVPDCLIVEEQRPQFRRQEEREGAAQGLGGVGIGLFYLGNLFWRNLYNLGLIKSFS